MGAGGYRKGAGRPFNSGKYRESTKVIRIPASLEKAVKLLIKERNMADATLRKMIAEDYAAEINYHNISVEMNCLQLESIPDIESNSIMRTHLESDIKTRTKRKATLEQRIKELETINGSK